MIGIGLLALVTACSSADKRLSELAGSWAGTVTVEGEVANVNATFTYENEEYLAGEVRIAEPRGTRTYSVRTAEVFSKVIAIDANTVDLVYNLDLDGEVTDGQFGGTATMRTDCGQPQQCGWQSPFTLAPGAPPLDTADTGAPEPEPEPEPVDDTAPLPLDTDTDNDTDTDPLEDTAQ